MTAAKQPRRRRRERFEDLGAARRALARLLTRIRESEPPVLYRPRRTRGR